MNFCRCRHSLRHKYLKIVVTEKVDVWASAIRIIDSNPGRMYRKVNDKLRRIKGTIYDDDIDQRRDVIKEQITDWLCLLQDLPIVLISIVASFMIAAALRKLMHHQ